MCIVKILLWNNCFHCNLRERERVGGGKSAGFFLGLARFPFGLTVNGSLVTMTITIFHGLRVIEHGHGRFLLIPVST